MLLYATQKIALRRTRRPTVRDAGVARLGSGRAARVMWTLRHKWYKTNAACSKSLKFAQRCLQNRKATNPLLDGRQNYVGFRTFFSTSARL